MTGVDMTKPRPRTIGALRLTQIMSERGLSVSDVAAMCAWPETRVQKFLRTKAPVPQRWAEYVQLYFAIKPTWWDIPIK